jgi:hypothetical protein
MKKMTMHPSLVPFFTPCHVTDDGKLKAYIAPVNHNNILEDMVVDICNTMMGDYCGVIAHTCKRWVMMLVLLSDGMKVSR